MRFGGRINAANAVMAERAQPRAEMMEMAAGWADRPSLTSRIGAVLVLGDLGIHHQDILRGLGRTRDVPEPMGRAILREGLQLSLWLNRRVLRHRIVPTDGGRPIGRERVVRGTREALGMWLCGRDAVAGELEFDPGRAAEGERRPRGCPKVGRARRGTAYSRRDHGRADPCGCCRTASWWPRG